MSCSFGDLRGDVSKCVKYSKTRGDLYRCFQFAAGPGAPKNRPAMKRKGKKGKTYARKYSYNTSNARVRRQSNSLLLHARAGKRAKRARG